MTDHQKMISKTEFIDVQKDMISIYIPCLINVSDFNMKLQYCIGHYMLYESYIKMSEFAEEMEVFIVFNREIDESTRKLLKIGNIKYKEKLAIV